jgi:hypothetical protein
MNPGQKLFPIPPTDPFHKKAKKFISKHLNLGILITLIVPGLGYYYFYTNNENIYRDRQLKNRPSFVIEKIDFDHKIKIAVTPKQLKDTNSLITKVPDLDLEVRFYLKNEGNAIGDLVGQFFFDTTSTSEIATKMIWNNNLGHNSRRMKDDLFDTQMIGINKEAVLKHSYRIQNYFKGVFIIHAFFLYENDDQQYFSSYYIAKFHINDLILEHDPENDSLSSAITNESIKNYVVYDTSNLIPGVYSKMEKKKILKYFEELRKSEFY